MQSPGHPIAAGLSAVLPGSGQACKGLPRRAIGTFVSALALLGLTWLIARSAGGGAAVFFVLMLVLPWWTIQSYDAFLPAGADRPFDFRDTLRTIWARAHDLRFLGALFLITAFTDLYIILANPSYALTVFCAKPAGVWGVLAKAQSPTLHSLIGYGFMRLRRWSLLLYLVYAAFGLSNAVANYGCFGYGRVRTVFLITLAGFTAYIWWRRGCFHS
jgi:hypothetical protein